MLEVDRERLAPAPRLARAFRPRRPHPARKTPVLTLTPLVGLTSRPARTARARTWGSTRRPARSRHALHVAISVKAYRGNRPTWKLRLPGVGRIAWRRCTLSPPCHTGTLRSHRPDDQRSLYCGPRHPRSRSCVPEVLFFHPACQLTRARLCSRSSILRLLRQGYLTPRACLTLLSSRLSLSFRA